MKRILTTFLLAVGFALLFVEPASAAITIIASTIVAGITAAATGAAVGASMLLAAGVATAQWGIRKIQELTKPKGAGGGSGVPTPAETAINGGARTASHVMGRAKVTPNDHLLAFVNTADGGNDRDYFNVFHVLSEGPCEGVEQIWIDDYLAMEAPKDVNGDYMTDGTNQHMTPTGAEYINDDGTVQTWQEVFQAARDDGKSIEEAIEVLDNSDVFRFQAIQRVRARDGGRRGTNPILLYGSGPGSVYLALWGTWCRAWIYPNGMTAADVTAVQNNIGASPDIPYEDDYRFTNKCVVHLQLEKSNFDSPFSTGIPKVDYVLKGRKITWPGQTTPAWTENAAAIRYWFHTELEDIPPAKIDRAEFDEAYAKCNEVVTFTTTDQDLQAKLANFSNGNLRYSINGLFLHDPSFYEQYKNDMDMAWQGNVVDSRGKLLFRAGYERPFAFTIDESNTVDTVTFVPQPAENDRVNAVRAVVQQSLDDNFEPVDLPIVEDPDAIARDLGRIRERELQGLRFIKYPISAMNVLHIFLRRVQAAARLTKVLQIDPTDFDGNTYSQIDCLDRVKVTDPELGLVEAPYEIVSWKRNEDWTLNVELQESPAGIFVDTLDIPEIQKRRLALPDATTRPTPVANFTATSAVGVVADGTIDWGIKVEYTASQHSVEIDIASADNSFTASHIIGPEVGHGEFTVPGAGIYTVEARHVNQFGRRSDFVEVSVDVHGRHLVPPAPVLDTSEIRGAVITLFFRPFAQTNYDISGIEFRYRVRALSNTTAFPVDPITAAQFEQLNRLSGDAVVSSSGGFTVNLQVPFSGRYQIFARSVTRQGLVSGPVDLGQYRLAGATPALGTESLSPTTQGTRSNMAILWADGRLLTDSQPTTFFIEDAIVHDRPDASALTFNDWNGNSGWPFGKETLSTWTINPALEFEQTGNYALRYRIGLFSPTRGANPTVNVTYQGMVNGVNAGNAVSAGAQDSPVNIRGINEVAVTVTLVSTGAAITGLRIFWDAIP